VKTIESSRFTESLVPGKPSLVMFYADWCPFCQKFKPVFEEIDHETKGEHRGFEVYNCKLNDDDNPLWDAFSINAIPTLIAFDGTTEHNIIARRDAKTGVGLTEGDLASLLKDLDGRKYQQNIKKKTKKRKP
jgi:thioredoxin